MIVRHCRPTYLDDPMATVFKAVHRATPHVRVGRGNHEAFAEGLVPLRGWYPIEILHFPVRSREQCLRKYVTQYLALGPEPGQRNAGADRRGVRRRRWRAGSTRSTTHSSSTTRRSSVDWQPGSSRSTRAYATFSARSPSRTDRSRDSACPPRVGARARSSALRSPTTRSSRPRRVSSRSPRRRCGSSSGLVRSSAGSASSSTPWARGSEAAREALAVTRPVDATPRVRADAPRRACSLRALPRRLLAPVARLADGEGPRHLGLPRLLPPVLRRRAAALPGAALPHAAHAARRSGCRSTSAGSSCSRSSSASSSPSRWSPGARRRSPSAGSLPSRPQRLLLVYPAWATLYHQASSDAVFATGLAVWALVLARALRRPEHRRLRRVRRRHRGARADPSREPGAAARSPRAAAGARGLAQAARLGRRVRSPPRCFRSRAGRCTTGSATTTAPSPVAGGHGCRSCASSPKGRSRRRTARRRGGWVSSSGTRFSTSNRFGPFASRSTRTSRTARTTRRSG